MAFDIYVGTFTRYYTNNWENVAQRQARLDGNEYRIVYAGKEPGTPPSSSEVQQAVSVWKQSINDGITQHGLEPIVWSEEEDQPYFTDRPDWPGYSGLLLWAAYAQFPEMPAPYELPECWYEDQAYQRAIQSDEDNIYPSILSANVWLPGDFHFRFDFPDLAEDEPASIASCSSLLSQLNALKDNEPKWSRPEVSEKCGNLSNKIPINEAAYIGHRIFTEMAEHAVRCHLPILLSF